MQFTTTSSIYEQIVDYVAVRILKKEWTGGDRLPSVRDLSVRLEVNPNTVQRSYSRLQDQGLIVNQRGVGYFVADNAFDRARTSRRDRFERIEIPRISREMNLLNIDIEAMGAMVRAYRSGTEESTQ